MYLVIVLLPLISFLVAILFGRKLGSYGSAFLTTFCLGLTFTISLLIFYEVALLGCFTYINLTTWIDSEVIHIDWGFMFDTLTSVMCCVVTFISFLVHLYSTEYMSHDPHLPRFMSYLSLFTFFMLILVTADNFIQMFMGWEGVGLCSYLLINFWFTRIQANKAAIKAMILNKIGDFGLIIGILLIFVNYKAVDYATVSVLTPFLQEKTVCFLNINFDLLSLIGFFLFVGAVGKSAQLGLHTWLPDAMEGPTPVSALIHAATMVTAGVFLISRCSFIYEYIDGILSFITVLGASTALFASSVGLTQNDMKRVIAYSTCSQLGYMVFVSGLSGYYAGIFHLSNHAFFKALLFLGAGSVIHGIYDEQDMRKMGGLKKLLPFTYSAMLIGSLALIGFPFLTGFYSKDLILEIAYGKYTQLSHLCYYFGTFGAFLTSFYSTRLLYLTFLSDSRGYKKVIVSAHESSAQMSIVLGILLLPTIFIGFYTRDMFVGPSSDFFGTSIFVRPNNFCYIDSEFIPFKFKILPLVLSILGAVLSFQIYNSNSQFIFKLKTSFLGKKYYKFLNRKWFFDKIYNESFSQFFFHSGYKISYKFVDRGIFESIGPSGLVNLVQKMSYNFHNINSGNFYHHTLIVLIGISSFLGVKQLWFLFDNLSDYRLVFVLFVSIFFLTFTKNSDK